MITGRQLARLRNEGRITQQRLAGLSGINKAYISEFETGIRPLQASDVKRLANAINNWEREHLIVKMMDLLGVSLWRMKEVLEREMTERERIDT